MTSDCLSLSLPQGVDRVRLEGWTCQPFDLGEGEEQGYHRPGRPRGDWLPAQPLTRRGGAGLTSVWYRLEFDHPGWSERTLLRFDGGFMATNVWLNGRLLGSHYGFPGHFGFDISSFLQVHNVLAVCVQATPDGGFLPPALSALEDGEGAWWPLGLVGRVWLERLGSVAVESLEVTWRLTSGTAQAQLRTVIRNLDARDMDVTVGWQLTAPDDGPTVRWRRSASISGRGTQALETTVAVDRPRLWWPWTLGEQALYTLGASVDCGDRRSTSVGRSVGIREIHLEPSGGGLTWMINGQRHFPRGAMLPPLPPGEDGDPIGAWRMAGLDLALSRGQIPTEATASLADSAGVMLVIDPPPSEHSHDDDDPVRDHQREAIGLVATHASAAVLLQRGSGTSYEGLPATTAAEEPYTLTGPMRDHLEEVRRAKFQPTTALVLERLPDMDEARGALAPTAALLEARPSPERGALILRFHVVNDDASCSGPALLRWWLRAEEGSSWPFRRERRGEIGVLIPQPHQAASVYEVEVGLPARASGLSADVVLEQGDRTLSELEYELPD